MMPALPSLLDLGPERITVTADEDLYFYIFLKTKISENFAIQRIE